jgi:hypothetical protein
MDSLPKEHRNELEIEDLDRKLVVEVERLFGINSFDSKV